MVRGINSVREWFGGYQENYVVIGGTACDLLMDEAGETFRATRDIDMVLIVEALSVEFGSRFWEYVKMAGYEQRLKNSGIPEYYRFINPKSPEYPFMIELFSRRIEGIALPADETLTPLPIDDENSSLSAILLDNDYYDYLRTGTVIVSGIPVLDSAHLIPFKAKAWLDLTQRKVKGGQVDSKNIRKHLNDIIRLSVLFSPDINMILPDSVAGDMARFLTEVDDSEKLIRIAAAYGLSDALS
jgi:hypothetical protein